MLIRVPLLSICCSIYKLCISWPDVDAFWTPPHGFKGKLIDHSTVLDNDCLFHSNTTSDADFGMLILLVR